MKDCRPIRIENCRLIEAVSEVILVWVFLSVPGVETADLEFESSKSVQVCLLRVLIL